MRRIALLVDDIVEGVANQDDCNKSEGGGLSSMSCFDCSEFFRYGGVWVFGACIALIPFFTEILVRYLGAGAEFSMMLLFGNIDLLYVCVTFVVLASVDIFRVYKERGGAGKVLFSINMVYLLYLLTFYIVCICIRVLNKGNTLFGIQIPPWFMLLLCVITIAVNVLTYVYCCVKNKDGR